MADHDLFFGIFDWIFPIKNAFCDVFPSTSAMRCDPQYQFQNENQQKQKNITGRLNGNFFTMIARF